MSLRRERISGVYAVINIITGEEYIGASKNIIKRWNLHRNELKRNVNYCTLLQNAWNKYGMYNFLFVLLEKTKDFKQRELDYCSSRNPAYNTMRAVNGKWIQTEGWKKLMSEVNTGNQYAKGSIRTKEFKDAVSEAMRNRVVTDETRKKLSIVNIGNRNSLGYHHTEEAKKRIGEASSKRMQLRWDNKKQLL